MKVRQLEIGGSESETNKKQKQCGRVRVTFRRSTAYKQVDHGTTDTVHHDAWVENDSH